MKLSDKLNRALAKKNLTGKAPPKPVSVPTPSRPKQVPKKETNTQYGTVPEGFQNLSKHSIDDDGIGTFTARELGMEEIQLPMILGDYVIEDIQRTKTGIIQVQFAKSEGNTE